MPAGTHDTTTGEQRPLGEIVRQPVFVLAVVSAMIGYGVMNLAMTATPLAMAEAGHDFNHVSTTIQWHVVAMFLPSFVTGRLTARFDASRMIVCGCLLLIASALTAQLDAGLAGFYAGLVLLGVAGTSPSCRPLACSPKRTAPPRRPAPRPPTNSWYSPP